MNNERINQIVNQVGTDVSGKWMGVSHVEEFTKLIIKDCIQTLRSNGYDDAALSLQDAHFKVCE
jgi:hypothetical protein